MKLISTLVALVLLTSMAFSQIPKRIVNQYIKSDTMIAGGTDVKKKLDSLAAYGNQDSIVALKARLLKLGPIRSGTLFYAVTSDSCISLVIGSGLTISHDTLKVSP